MKWYREWRARLARLEELRHELRSIGDFVMSRRPWVDARDIIGDRHDRVCKEIESLKRWYDI